MDLSFKHAAQIQANALITFPIVRKGPAFPLIVIPAKAGIQIRAPIWTPACAG
jgi:hypothetical protein